MACLTKTHFTNLPIFPCKLTCSITTPVNNHLKLSKRKSMTVLPLRCSANNLPMESLMSSVGKSLSSVIMNEPNLFYKAVSRELKGLSHDCDSAFLRSRLSVASTEATLHRRIAELKEAECQVAVEDALYMIISYRFSEIRVPLVPSLSRCLYNSRLEILPSKDWELESIHSPEMLEMVREHLSLVLGWKAGSSVSVNWSTTQVHRRHLSQVYQGSILFGYFLKSVSLRLRLEHNLPQTFENVAHGSHSMKNAVFGQMLSTGCATLSQVSNRLGWYVTGLDMETRNVCGKVKSQEGVELIEKHCGALFGNEGDKNEVILTSLSSMKRLVLEAVAFGCFLWDAEQFISPIYKLKDN